MARDHLARAVCGVGFLANISIFAAKTALAIPSRSKHRASTRINPRFPSVNFFSGGQTPEEATANLDAMNRLAPQPWQLSFSYGRALQEPALRAWQGQAAHARSSQDSLLERARLNSATCQAQYTAAMEAAGPKSRLA